MRTQIVLLWISLSLMVGLSACDWTSSSPVASLRRATGWPFEVVVVMDRDAWNGEVGELLQEQLRAPIPACLKRKHLCVSPIRSHRAFPVYYDTYEIS